MTMLMKKLRDAISRRLKRFINNQAGFTLIELVMVIVILGILAATAVPKFMDLTAGAVRSVGNAAAGALSSSAAILYAKSALVNPAAPSYPVCSSDIGTVVDAVSEEGVPGYVPAYITDVGLLGGVSINGITDMACATGGSTEAELIEGKISSAAGCTWTYNATKVDVVDGLSAGSVIFNGCVDAG